MQHPLLLAIALLVLAGTAHAQQVTTPMLPAPGVVVDEAAFNGAMGASNAPCKANPSGLYQKYKARLTKRTHELD